MDDVLTAWNHQTWHNDLRDSVTRKELFAWVRNCMQSIGTHVFASLTGLQLKSLKRIDLQLKDVSRDELRANLESFVTK